MLYVACCSKGTLLQASPEEIKKQEEDADGAMKELLEEEDTAAGAPAAASHMKTLAKRVNERSRQAVEGQDVSKREEE